jgi:hypothetical protein
MNKANSDTPFQSCSAERVFWEISAQTDTPEIRALWTRLQDEIQRQGVSAARTYLDAEFTTLKEELDRELAAAKIA